MTVFDTTGRSPGVYIQEVATPGPIPGVATSVAAFLGPASAGPFDTPTSLANWTAFARIFGTSVAGADPAPSSAAYATHAIRGYYENGGRHCVFVRAGTAGTEPTNEDYKRAIDTLRRVDEVTLVCCPDKAGDPEIQSYVLAHCEALQDRFALLDPPAIDATDTDVTARLLAFRNGTDAVAGISSDGGYGAMYFPWLVPSSSGGPVAVPPSGHVAGMIARVDGTRGVHKAPANEVLQGIKGVQVVLTDDEQGPLNDAGVNAIRPFVGRGVVVWGARTVAPTSRTQWRYVNVRRLLLFIEESLQEGTQFAVFEPNNLQLWQTVKRQVTDFLTRVWQSGALFGGTPAEAFRVRVDEELNPPAERALGKLVIEVLLYPTTPAEFIVIRVIQRPGGPAVEEQ